MISSKVVCVNSSAKCMKDGCLLIHSCAEKGDRNYDTKNEAQSNESDFDIK